VQGQDTPSGTHHGSPGRADGSRETHGAPPAFTFDEDYVDSDDAPPSIGWSGEVIHRRYRLDEVLGRGGTGTVWRGTHLGYGVPVAIKLLRREHLSAATVRRRFFLEARSIMSLRSRFVVRTFDVGKSEGGIPFSVMELLTGETLEQLLEREGRLPLDVVVRIAVQLARGLSLAHSHRVIHRDVKPSNVFLHAPNADEQPVAKLIDFGIAKVMDDSSRSWSTTTGLVLGTPAYMSPEQALGMPWVDHHADLYSLGMLVFHLLTGRTAFEGAGYGQILLSVCTGELPRLRAHVPKLPAALEEWFDKACARNPSDRFDRAQQLAVALKEASGIEGSLDELLGTGSPPFHPLDLLPESFPEEPPTLHRAQAEPEAPFPLLRENSPRSVREREPARDASRNELGSRPRQTRGRG
jgi:serine/threonine-protein kinase